MLIEAIIIIFVVAAWLIMARKFEKIGSLVLKMLQPFRQAKEESKSNNVEKEDEKDVTKRNQF